MTSSQRATAFQGHRRLAAGPLDTVLTAIRKATPVGDGPLLTFDDATGSVIDLDLRQQKEGAERPPRSDSGESAVPPARGRGRPRLGVVAREVTLLPRHWEWLASQRGGASAALRRLVEEARRGSATGDRQRMAAERTYRFIHAMAGDLPGYEEATRALFAHDRTGFAERISGWPADVQEYALRLVAEID
jgi:hypothetical protein